MNCIVHLACLVDITTKETTMALLNKAPSLQSGVQRKLGRRRQHVVCQASEQYEPKPLLNIRNTVAAGVASVVSLGTCVRVYASTQASKAPWPFCKQQLCSKHNCTCGAMRP